MITLSYTRKLILTLLVATAYLLLVATPVFADPPPGGGGGTSPGGGGGTAPKSVEVAVKFTNPFSIGNNLYEVARGIVEKVVLPIGGILCVLAFIYAGFMYVMAQGSPTKIQNANRMLLYAAIGTAVLLGAWAIATVVENTITKIIS